MGIYDFSGNVMTPSSPNNDKVVKSVHFSSARQNWKTPKAFYQALDAEFKFDFDPCPPKPTFDGLNVQWGGA